MLWKLKTVRISSGIWDARVRKVARLVVSLGVISFWSSSAWAEDQAKDETKVEFEPRTGESLDYSKKFYPDQESRDWFLEINPLILLTRTLVLESEARISEGYTLGVDLLYRDAAVHDSNGVKGNLTSFGLAPKVRFYPLPTLSGVFFGVKVLVSSVRAEISGTETKEWDQVVVAPIAHVGYRITSKRGVTLALYLGGGVNIPELEISESDFPNFAAKPSERQDWLAAASELRQQESRFKPDFGLSLGIAL